MPPRPFPEALGRRRPSRQNRPVVQEAAQVVGQFLSRGVALRRLLAERLQHNGFQLRWQGRIHGTRRARLFAADLPQQFVAVAALKELRQGEHFVEGSAERIDVTAMVHHAAPGQNLLGAGVAQRAQNLPGDGEADVAADLGQAEVGDPELPARVQKQVGRLDVAVDDAHRMGVFQREGRLPAQTRHPIVIAPTAGGSLRGECRRNGGVSVIADLRLQIGRCVARTNAAICNLKSAIAIRARLCPSMNCMA